MVQLTGLRSRIIRRGAGLMSRMLVESRGWKIILRVIQVRVRGK